MKFRIAHILSVTAIIAVLLAGAMYLLSPFIHHFGSINAAQHRIIHEFDHTSIRDSAIELLAKNPDGFIDKHELPESLSVTNPNSVYIGDGCVTLEYGSGFAHYGLIIDPSNRKFANTPNQDNGQYYEETKLTDGVYFYESE